MERIDNLDSEQVNLDSRLKEFEVHVQETMDNTINKLFRKIKAEDEKFVELNKKVKVHEKQLNHLK